MKNLITVLILIVGMNLIFPHQIPLYAQSMEAGYYHYLVDSARQDSVKSSIADSSKPSSKSKIVVKENSLEAVIISVHSTMYFVIAAISALLIGLVLLVVAHSVARKKHPINVVRNFFGYEDWGDG